MENGSERWRLLHSLFWKDIEDGTVASKHKTFEKPLKRTIFAFLNELQSTNTIWTTNVVSHTFNFYFDERPPQNGSWKGICEGQLAK